MSGDVVEFSQVKFRTLLRDTRGPTNATNEVLHTQEQLDGYVESCQDKQQPRHVVAFPEERVIAVALGARPHGGDHVEIVAVVQETGGVVGVQHHVLYVEHVPHGLATDMITYPQHVIRLRGIGGIVSFRQVPDWLGHSLYALAGATLGENRRQPTAPAIGGHRQAAASLVGEGGDPTGDALVSWLYARSAPSSLG